MEKEKVDSMLEEILQEWKEVGNVLLNKRADGHDAASCFECQVYLGVCEREFFVRNADILLETAVFQEDTLSMLFTLFPHVRAKVIKQMLKGMVLTILAMHRIQEKKNASSVQGT